MKEKRVGRAMRHESLQRAAQEGRMERKQTRSERRTALINEIKNSRSYEKILKNAQDPEE